MSEQTVSIQKNQESDVCMVCGRDQDQLKHLQTGDLGLVQHQSITKCVKCRDEYLAEKHSTGEEESRGLQDESEPVSPDSEDWKDQVTA